MRRAWEVLCSSLVLRRTTTTGRLVWQLQVAVVEQLEYSFLGLELEPGLIAGHNYGLCDVLLDLLVLQSLGDVLSPRVLG